MAEKSSNSARKKAIERFLSQTKQSLTKEEMLEGIYKGDFQILSQAITLLESTHPSHSELASEIVHACLQKQKSTIRIGITGVPGVGKSTFIEAFGTHLTEKGLKTAVLAVDPSSNVNKGSILGDKTRMESLSVNPLAFVRPSPSSGALGGVANATRESIILCEAAGFDVIIVETVGVGQSEYQVREMVDFFLLLMLSGAGDEIQGIKRGIMEMADALFVNKADGKNVLKAQKAAKAYASALHLFPPRKDMWIPEVGTCSALEQTEMDIVWEIITSYHDKLTRNGWFDKKRQEQLETWMNELINSELRKTFYSNPQVSELLNPTKKEVLEGKITPFAGAKLLLQKFHSKIKK